MMMHHAGTSVTSSHRMITKSITKTIFRDLFLNW